MKMIGKLKAKHLGAAKTACAFTDAEVAEGKIHLMGVIIGKVHDIKRTADTKDDTNIGWALIGFFEGVPADLARDTMHSTVCWLPGSVHDDVVKAVRAQPEGSLFPIAFRIGTQKCKTQEAGYVYVVDDLSPGLRPQDPLADLRTAVFPPPPKAKK